MRHETLSRRYAAALADVAEEEGELARVRDELLELAQAMASERGFIVLVKTPTKNREEKKDFFRRLSERLDLCPCTRRVLELLVEKARGGILPDLARTFAHIADRRLGVVRAEVTSAAPLTEEQRARIKNRLEDIVRKEVHIEERVDEGLIAGFQVRLDGKFFDGSLRARIKRIRERMAHAR
ncbi:MAG: ATP synthase F1 subunit delta [Planctomycetota bacterium]